MVNGFLTLAYWKSVVGNLTTKEITHRQWKARQQRVQVKSLATVWPLSTECHCESRQSKSNSSIKQRKENIPSTRLQSLVQRASTYPRSLQQQLHSRCRLKRPSELVPDTVFLQRSTVILVLTSV